MTVPNSTRDRVRKLLALSTSTNESESAAAMALARKLMAQYQLTIEEVHGSDLEEPGIVKQSADGAYVEWERTLAICVAENFGCYAYVSHQRGKRYGTFHFVGRKEDVELCIYARENLIAQLKRLANAAWRMKGAGKTSYSRTKWIGDYKVAAVCRLADNLREARRSEESNVTALVLAKDNAAKEWAHAQAKLGPSRARAQLQASSAVAAGYRDGDKLSIQNGLTGKTVAQLGGA